MTVWDRLCLPNVHLMLIFLVEKFNQNDLTNNLNGLRRIWISFSIVVSILLDTSLPVCSADCQDAPWEQMHPGEVMNSWPCSFSCWWTVGKITFFIADGNTPKCDCVEGLWNVTSSRILHGDSLDAGVWFSTIPLHLLVSSSPQSSHPGYTDVEE